MVDGATTVLFQYGLAGVVIFALTAAVVYLYKSNVALLEARRKDAEETRDTVTKTLSDLAQTTEHIYEKLVIGKEL